MNKPPEIPQVAIMVNTAQDWGRRLIRGVVAYANEKGPWYIWVKPNATYPGERLPEGWRGDGIIARVINKDQADEIKALKVPIVDVSDNPIDGFEVPRILTDDKVGCEMAIQHFAERGIRNLAFIGANNRPTPVKYAEAFENIALQNGYTCSQFEVNTISPDADEEIIDWLKSLPKPCGVLAMGNNHARNLVDCCGTAGIIIPHDIAVLCTTDDELLNHACFPALSGILPPTESIGYQAAANLHRQMLGEEVSKEPVYLPPKGVIARLSTETLAVEDPKLVQVAYFIREHAFEPITMSDILKEVPMARRSLERRFQKAFGRSPVDEIRRIRVDRARKLLAETDLTMQSIAEACGYATYNYLTRVFKQITGMTPIDYRKQNRI